MAPSKTIEVIEETLGKPSPEERLEESARENAAIKIQRAWRARQRAKVLGPQFLWSDLTNHARTQVNDLSLIFDCLV